MKKLQAGIIFGIAAGLVDIIPMIMQNLTWDANLSAFSLWVVSGYIIATSNLKMKGHLKGLLISFLIMIPCAILIGWYEPVLLLPIGAMTIVLGSMLGFAIERYGK